MTESNEGDSCNISAFVLQQYLLH